MKGDKELWKPADGKQLPPIDKEVVALVGTDYPPHYRVVFAHRVNPNGDAFEYGIGGWNIPRVKYWLDAELPNIDEESHENRKRKWFFEIRNGNGEVVRSRAFDTYEEAEQDLARFDGLRNGFHRFTYEFIDRLE